MFPKHKEHAISAEQCYESFVELSEDWSWELDEQLRTVRNSSDTGKAAAEKYESNYGVIGSVLHISGDQVMAWSDHQLQLQQKKSFRNFEQKRTDENGDVVWLSSSGNPIFDSNSKFIGYCGISRFITEQKKSEAALKESEERLRLSVNMSGIGIWEWDMISDDVVWDKRQFQLFGRPEVEGKISLSSITEAIHPDDQEQLAKSASRVMENGETAAEEFRITLPDGSERWLMGSSGVVYFNDNKTVAHLVGVNMDITQAKQTEFALRESQNNLLKINTTLEARVAERTAELQDEAERHESTQSKLALYQRLESIGQLAGGVAHDFNNLLAIIGGNLELALPHIQHAEAVELVSKSLVAVNSGASINRRLLTFARKKNLKPINLCVGNHLRDVIELLDRTLGENVSIINMIDPATWDTFVDPGEIDSALINLSINARDAMPDGGQLTIESRNVVLTEEDTELHPNTLPGDYIGLYVTDSGVGMSNEILQRSIDPFFTTKEKGTGLGLSSVYGFAQQSGGFLVIDSHVGSGTTISMFLPRVTAETDCYTVPVTVSSALNAEGEIILVVEDDPMVRELTVQRLQHIGYKVLEASSGQDAMDILKDDIDIKLVFSDVVMPGGMNGYELERWIIKNRPEVQTLLTSGYHDPDLIGSRQAADMVNAMLEKPYQPDQLARSIRRALDA